MHNTGFSSSGWKIRSRFEAFSAIWLCVWVCGYTYLIQLKQTRKTKPLKRFFKIICDYMLPGLCRVSVWVKPGWYFSPGWSLILIVHSCQLSKPTAHVSFGVWIFRCENAFFSQSGERVSNFPLERVPTAFQPRSDRCVRLFLSSVELCFTTAKQTGRTSTMTLPSVFRLFYQKVWTMTPLIIPLLISI